MPGDFGIVKRFIALDAQMSVCNLRCPYCYVRQQGRDLHCMPDYAPIIPKILSSFSAEVLGGTALIYLYADGEPLLPPSMADVISELLRAGHYVAVVSNMTCAETLDRLAALPREWRRKLLFFCSLHYTELQRTNALGQFVSHIAMMRAAGCSCVVRLCLAPEYLPILAEIRSFCREYLGGDPVICHYVEDHGIDEATEKTLEEAASRFHCGAYAFQKQINRVPVTDFCHAGEWSYAIGLLSGEVRDCLHGRVLHHLYASPGTPIPRRPVGCSCPLPWCMCGAHFLSWGVRPSVVAPPYARFFNVNGTCYLSAELQQVFATKLDAANADS